MTKFDDWIRKNGLEHLNGALLRFIHAAWTAADRQARENCAAIVEDFDQCDPKYLAEKIRETTK
jgi:hypothetical protein